MKCLIVEDETRVRLSIMMMGHWKAFGINELLEAPNGKIGFRQAQDKKPELIITDMHMDTMDGVGFLNAIRGIDSYYPQVLVISGHQDYQYMRSAIESNATDYILKPISEEVLNQSILRMLNQSHLQRGNMVSQFESAILNLTNDQQQLTSLNESLLSFPLLNEFIYSHEKCILFIPYFINFGAVCQKSYHSLTDLLCLKIQQIIETVCHRDGLGQCLVLRVSSANDWNFVCLFAPGEAVADTPAITELFATIRRDIHALDIQTILCYDPICDDRVSLDTSFQAILQARQTLNLQYPYDVLSLESIPYAQAEATPVLPDAKKLESALLINAGDDAYRLISNGIDRVCETNRLTETFLRSLWIEFIKLLNGIFVQHSVRTDDILTYVSTWRSIRMDLCDITSIKSFFRESIDNACYLLCRQSKHESRLLCETMRYFEEHYSDKIKQTCVARHLCVSSEHLCRVIQHECGKTFTQLLNECRMKHVRRLLLNTDDSLIAIAMKTGYGDANYLNRVFRKFYGITPIAYRHRQQTPYN